MKWLCDRCCKHAPVHKIGYLDWLMDLDERYRSLIVELTVFATESSHTVGEQQNVAVCVMVSSGHAAPFDQLLW